MLQQTQMERGVEYFLRWLSHLPNVEAVAKAKEEKILKLWEGLGYYARARNLHKTAKILMDSYDGKLPVDRESLLLLPGVGPYTASAIASIAYNQDIPVVDANVERVFARLFDIDAPLKKPNTKKRVEKLAWELLPLGQSRLFNQALMDFGGLHCTPKKPQCSLCPLKNQCLAYYRGVVAERPVPVKGKKILPIVMSTGILIHDKRIFIQKRLEDDIWGGLWEFPGGRQEGMETPEDTVLREFLEETEMKVSVSKFVTTIIHHYTRYKVILHCFTCLLDQEADVPVLHAAQESRWVYPKQLKEFGFPAGHRKLIEFMQDKEILGLIEI